MNLQILKITSNNIYNVLKVEVATTYINFNNTINISSRQNQIINVFKMSKQILNVHKHKKKKTKSHLPHLHF